MGVTRTDLSVLGESEGNMDFTVQPGGGVDIGTPKDRSADCRRVAAGFLRRRRDEHVQGRRGCRDSFWSSLTGVLGVAASKSARSGRCKEGVTSDASTCARTPPVVCSIGLRWGPSRNPTRPTPPADSDRDGFNDVVDGCPNSAENFNKVFDRDGCPDTSLDLYSAVRTDVETYWLNYFGSVLFRQGPSYR